MNRHRFESLIVSNKVGMVTYIMSDAFRLHYNHGLEKVIELSDNNPQNIQIILLRVPEENKRNNDFFNEGIRGYKTFLSKITRNVYYFEELSEPFFSIISNSSIIIKDRAYLSEHLAIEKEIIDFSSSNSISLTLVESNVLVPVIYASNKEEYGARTIRPKIMKNIEQFMDFSDTKSPYFFFEQKAQELLEIFIEHKLSKYHESNDPSKMYLSELSPYLKYGFISPLDIYNKVLQSDNTNRDDFIEELVVRRELAYNFVFYNRKYNQFDHMTHDWAYKTMYAHRLDEKEYVYKKEDYINFKTHDIYFNTAMKEMIHFGKMHGYMRMYWAKKIIEWSITFEEAYNTIIELNNFYFFDGNNPNGYAGAAWVFGKHDRAWGERLVFGKLRYMNQNGLKRKFDIDDYVRRIDFLINNKK